MSSFVIVEKPDVMERYKAVIGQNYGPILPARGHLFELAPPEAVNEAWAKWTMDVLRPPSGRYPIQHSSKDKDGSLKRLYAAIKAEAGRRDAIYIATDPDREGEGIGRNIVAMLEQDLGRTWRLVRVLILGGDPKSIQDGFANARPASESRDFYESYIARSQADQIYNLSLTRACSEAFHPKGSPGYLPVGRVLTPTLALAARREIEIRDFKPQTYYLPWVTVKGAAGSAKLVHQTAEEDRFLKEEDALTVARTAGAYKGPIAVKRERKALGPPALFSLSQLQVAMSSYKKWNPSKTLDVLQALYQNHQLVTYPRSSENTLPEAEIANAPAMKAGLLALPFTGKPSWATAAPVIRKKAGAFSDKALKGAAHYAIVPNINTVEGWGKAYVRLNPDERDLFHVIALRYLAAIAPDRIVDQTRLSIEVQKRVYAANGLVEIEAGWREALKAQTGVAAKDAGSGEGEAETEEEEEEALPEEGALPAFKDQDPVEGVKSGADKKTTSPPTAFNEATLIAAMVQAWKYVDDPEVRKTLKTTDGIGTEATRSNIVGNLIRRGLLESKSANKVALTARGFELYGLLAEAAPEILDVGLTGRMEITLESVKSGDVTADAAINEVVDVAERAIEAMKAAKANGVMVTNAAPRAPTEPMKAAARKKAERTGGKVPRGVLADAALCRQYLGGDRQRNEDGSYAPSETQMNFAKDVAQTLGIEIPAAEARDGKKLKVWLDAHTPAYEKARPPSEKMVSMARDIAARSGTGLSEATLSNRAALSQWLEENAETGPPSEKAIAYARDIATKKGVEIPAAALESKAELSAWFTAQGVVTKPSGGASKSGSNATKRSGSGAPSAKALGLARYLSRKNGVPIPAEVEKDDRKLSRWIDEQKAAAEA